MTKKVCKQFFLLVITKNPNWEILTKNLGTFKRQDGGEGWKTLIFLWFMEKSDFQGGYEKPIYRGRVPEKGGLDSLQI